MKSRSVLASRVVNLLLGVYCATTVLGRLDVEDSNDEVILTHGDVKLVINKSPWRLQIYHNSTGALVLSEATVADHRLGFGRWEGEYLDIYEGYLFRVGLITEWYHASNVLNWTYSEDDSIRVTVATSDPKGRVIAVYIGSFVGERQFSMNAMVEGEDASKSNRVHMGFQIKKEEGFYGFGERFDDCNQRGHRVGSWCEDGSFGLGMFAPDKLKLRVPKGELSTYVPMPLGISSEGYGLQMDTYYRTVFDLGKSTDNVMKLEQEANHLNVTFFLGLTPCETFLMQADKNGKSLIPPLWEFAPWNQLDTEKAGVDQVTRAKQLLFDDNIPCSHNVRTIHFFPSGEERGQEDQLKAANEELLAIGIKSTAYFNPTVAHSYEEFYSFCAVNNFFLTKEDGLPYNFTYFTGSKNYVSMLDFTNGIMVKWYQEQMDRAVKTVGYHGWMYDYGEYTPPYSNASNGDNGLSLHNHYPLLYQQAAFDYFTGLDPDPGDAYAPDYVYYVRSGYLGSQKVTWAHWTGDPSSDWNFASGLPAQINAGISIGLSGMPFSGSDIGGFEWYVDSSPPDLELWSRWTEAGCFSGLMREQGGGTGFVRKTHIFDWPEGTLIWRKYTKLRMQLLPYIYTQAHIAHETGLPLVRHHILHFPNDSTAVKQQQQYMFGEDFLVAPVITKNAREWNVYLPAGETWLDVGSTFQYEETDGRFRIGFSGFMQGSQTVKVFAPLDVTPLFIRCGSVIPVADPRIMTVNNATNSSVITWQSLKHLRNLWIWVNENWTANGWSWDNELYTVSPIGKGIQLSISGNAEEKFSHIVQIAAPWNGTKISTVYANDTAGNGVMLQMKQSWQELVNDAVMAGWYQDEGQQSVWLKLEPAYTLATILTSYESTEINGSFRKEGSEKDSFLATLVYRGKQQYGGGGAAKRDRPPPSPQPGKLIVRGYPEGTDDNELRSLFERFGKLEEVFSPPDRETRKPRGFTFVKFCNPEDAESAIKAMDGTDFRGARLRVEHSLFPKGDGGPPKNRGGGGLLPIGGRGGGDRRRDDYYGGRDQGGQSRGGGDYDYYSRDGGGRGGGGGGDYYDYFYRRSPPPGPPRDPYYYDSRGADPYYRDRYPPADRYASSDRYGPPPDRYPPPERDRYAGASDRYRYPPSTDRYDRVAPTGGGGGASTNTGGDRYGYSREYYDQRRDYDSSSYYNSGNGYSTSGYSNASRGPEKDGYGGGSVMGGGGAYGGGGGYGSGQNVEGSISYPTGYSTPADPSHPSSAYGGGGGHY